MIVLHKLSHEREAFHLNPDLILTIEPRPDTVISLTTHTKFVVSETPEEVAAAVRRYRVSIFAEALRLSRRGAGLSALGDLV